MLQCFPDNFALLRPSPLRTGIRAPQPASMHRAQRMQARALTDVPLKTPSPIILDGQVLHSITAERLDIVRSLEQHVVDNVSAATQAACCHGDSWRHRIARR